MIENPVMEPTLANYVLYTGEVEPYRNNIIFVLAQLSLPVQAGYYMITTKHNRNHREELFLSPENTEIMLSGIEIHKFMWYAPSGMVLVKDYAADGDFAYIRHAFFDPHFRQFVNPERQVQSFIYTAQLSQVSNRYFQRFEAHIYEALLKWDG